MYARTILLRTVVSCHEILFREVSRVAGTLVWNRSHPAPALTVGIESLLLCCRILEWAGMPPSDEIDCLARTCTLLRNLFEPWLFEVLLFPWIFVCVFVTVLCGNLEYEYSAVSK